MGGGQGDIYRVKMYKKVRFLNESIGNASCTVALNVELRRAAKWISKREFCRRLFGVAFDVGVVHQHLLPISCYLPFATGHLYLSKIYVAPRLHGPYFF